MPMPEVATAWGNEALGDLNLTVTVWSSTTVLLSYVAK